MRAKKEASLKEVLRMLGEEKRELLNMISDLDEKVEEKEVEIIQIKKMLE